MKLKLTKAEMQALEVEIDRALNNMPKESFLQKLFMSEMERLYIKVATKLIVLKKNYSFGIDASMGLAFVIIFSTKKLKPEKFEDNMLLKILNQLKQHYA